MSMRSVQRGLITEQVCSCSCNFIADWTIVLGKISIAGLDLATCQLATTDLLEHSHPPGLDFFFQNIHLGRKVSFRDLSNTLGFQSDLSSLQ